MEPSLFRKLISFFFFHFLFLISTSYSQVVVTVPVYPVDADSCRVIFDASQGNQGLLNATAPLYAHTGVITNLSISPSDWKYVVAEWTQNLPKARLISLGNNLWELKVTPSIRDYYGVPEGEEIQQMAFVFRNSDGSKTGRNEDGSDIFANVYPPELSIKIILPEQEDLILKSGDSITVSATSPQADTLYLYRNNVLVHKNAGHTITDTLAAEFWGNYWACFWVRIVAANDTGSVADSFSYRVIPDPPVSELPAGVTDGINYIDTATVILCLYAPEKQHCFAIGDFNSWKADSLFYMNRTPDGKRYWIQLNNLVPRQEYRFQYLVDGSTRVGDPYADKVSDPDDQYISSSTYPNLIPYPTGLTTDIATVFQTGQDPYPWNTEPFIPPDVRDLVIYEILLRDFTSAHDFNSLADTLDYLKRLGVNAIELMPVMEFEGNISWGYNPDFSFAVDKYYGPKNTLKQLVEKAHLQGIAVILDIVCNHHFGKSPLVRLYWDGTAQQPAANSPWFNVIPRHPYNVGYDFNHESAVTRQYMERLIRYWLEEYHIDGYRFDLSKGFTQTNSYPNNVSLWGMYDASRIAILKNYESVIHSVNPEAYMILEHFADNSEEKVLSADSMLLWGNMTNKYGEAAKGFNTGSGSDFSWINYQQRGWTEPHVVGYMESHDEERQMYKCISAGNTLAPPYNVRDTNTALKRAELAANFFFTVPGPKMLWQFEELGYDYSINYPTGTSDSRLSPKPVRWDYQDQWRRRYTYNIFAALISLKATQPVFSTTDFTLDVSGASKRICLRHETMDAVVLGNYDVTGKDITPGFTRTGKWYEFYTGDSLDVTDPASPLSFAAGEYRIYTTLRLPKPLFTGTGDVPSVLPGIHTRVFPNPCDGEFFMEVSLSRPDRVSITLTDLTGRETYRIFEGELSSGTHLLHFGTNLPAEIRMAPGLYLYRCSCSSGSGNGKIMTE